MPAYSATRTVLIAGEDLIRLWAGPSQRAHLYDLSRGTPDVGSDLLLRLLLRRFDTTNAPAGSLSIAKYDPLTASPGATATDQTGNFTLRGTVLELALHSLEVVRWLVEAGHEIAEQSTPSLNKGVSLSFAGSGGMNQTATISWWE